MEIKISSDAEKILREFNKTETVEKDVSKLIKNTLHNIEKDAKRSCPVDTGRLRGSITTNIISSYSGEVGTNVEYAGWVEYGTRYQSAQPYFEPAVEKNEDKFNEELDKIIEELIK
jgi:HK97 gp10 family phage protein|nr:MAG TPA: putative tail component [Caudoviricetes sp.]